MGGPSLNIPCIFPFKFNGRTFNECTWDEDGAWCSTQVDKNGNHVGGQGKWGLCGQECPIPPKPS